jgi:hypothetical protein
VTEEQVIERITLLGELMLQVHEDMAKLTGALIILDRRLAAVEARVPQDRGIGRSP